MILAERKAAEEQYRILTLQLRKMEAKVQALMQQYFGRSSGQLDPNQLKLALDSVMADDALVEEVSPVPLNPAHPPSAGSVGSRICRSWRRSAWSRPSKGARPPMAPPWSSSARRLTTARAFSSAARSSVPSTPAPPMPRLP
jgi:hypothetical protein